jgi:hypothetical protein
MMKAKRTDNLHTPDNNIQARVTMVKATDDSYIFSLTLTTLQKLCLEAERFQYAYGWLTQWAKTKAYVLHPTEDTLGMVLMPSITVVDGVHPWTILQHKVPLKVGKLKFL